MPKAVDVDERRSELTDAAARLIARAGIEAATMRDVAAEAGLTTGALTHYFADKRELMLRTFQASLERRRALRAGRDPHDPRGALVAALEGALPLDDDRRRHWMVTIAFCSQAVGDAELAAAQRDAYREFRGHVTELVRRCRLASGRASSRLAERLIAVADGVAVQALFDPETWTPRHQRAALHAALRAVTEPSV
jgi:AcrR family transcriptional regulator